MQGMTFGFGALEIEFWRWVFLMTRIGAALLAAPFFGTANVAPQVRVSMAAAIALLVANWTHATAPVALFSLAGFVAVLGEVVIGLMLGFVLQFAFAAPTIAAELIGGGMGMGLAATIDPNTGSHSPALGQYFTVILTLVFLGLGCHLQWIALVVRSYEVLPPGHVLGAGGIGAGQFAQMAGFGSALFATAVAMALPVTLVLLLIQIVAGVLSRSAPALNLFALGLPSAIVAGFAAMVASAPMLTDRMMALSAQAVADAARLVGG